MFDVSPLMLSQQAALPPTTQPLPRHAAEDVQIAQLTELYQGQLAELNACHSLLLADQERLAAMLAPHMTPSGQIDPSAVAALDPRVLLFKEGLDLRLAEFQEDCKRIQATEKRLQRRIELAAADYEANFLATSGLADARILKRLKEQQRLIQIQQAELDQVRFEKELLEGENNRLKVMCVTGDREMSWESGSSSRQAPFTDRPNLHMAAEGRMKPPERVIHGGGVVPSVTAAPRAEKQVDPTPLEERGSWLGSLLGATAVASPAAQPRMVRGSSFL